MATRPLHRQYCYSTRYSGVLGEAITVVPVGLADARAENLFNAEVQLLTISLFGEGYAANAVYTSYPPAVFQHPDMAVNRARARQVMDKWRACKRAGTDIMAEYRRFSPAYRLLGPTPTGVPRLRRALRRLAWAAAHLSPERRMALTVLWMGIVCMAIPWLLVALYSPAIHLTRDARAFVVFFLPELLGAWLATVYGMHHLPHSPARAMLVLVALVISGATLISLLTSSYFSLPPAH